MLTQGGRGRGRHLDDSPPVPGSPRRSASTAARKTPLTLGTLLVIAAAAFAGEPLAPPAASPSPSAAPRYKLIPYGFESVRDASPLPLLRFEDETEVRALEMNAAIARFFDRTEDKGNMLRGATPGGAPTLREMGPYRPHVAPSLNLLGAILAVIESRKRERTTTSPKGEALLRALLLAAPTPTASPTPSPSPTSTPS